MVTEAKLNDGSGTGYAYGLQLGDLNGHRKVSHGGGINGFNTQLSQYPDDNLVITVLTNTNGSGPQALESQIARLALGLPLEVTLDLPTDNVDLTRYEGSYNFEAIGATVQVEARADGLWILALGAAEMRLKYQGGDLFEMAPGQRIQFFPDADPPRADLLAGGGSITGIKESNE